MGSKLPLFFLFSLITKIICSEGNVNVELVIVPSPKPKGFTLLKRVEETLNLTCSVTSQETDMLPKYHLMWQLPFIPQNSQNRVTYGIGHNMLSLVIQNLKESDSGDYNCEAKLGDEFIRESVKINVKNKKNCNEQTFPCPSGACIPRRYMCDGHQDCKSGADEAELHCGPDACEGKIYCEENGRCIPQNWCCDQHIDPNCTVKIRPSCCKQKGKMYMEHHDGSTSEQQRFSDVGFLQTTIYTVIGSAMASMFIVTILVVAICRVYMKRTSTFPGITAVATSRGIRFTSGGSRFPAGGVGRGGTAHSLLSHHPPHESLSAGAAVGSASPLHPLQLYDWDLCLNAAAGLPSVNGRDAVQSPQSSNQNPHSLLVTYNINNGVQFVGRPVDPPPYCEIMSAPPREGPPPPYVSQEDISSAVATTQVSSVPSASISTIRTNAVSSPIHTVSSSPVILQTVEESQQTDEEARVREPQPTDSLLGPNSEERSNACESND